MKINSQEHYGKLISDHPYNLSADRNKILVPLFSASFGILLAFFAQADAAYSIMLITMSILFALIFTGRALPHGVIYLWKAPSIQLYENGLLYRDRRTEKFMDWEMIDDVREIPLPLSSPIPEISLRYKRKQLVRLTNRYKNALDLQKSIINALIQHRAYQKILDDGGTIQSGKLTLTCEGILAKKKEIRWEQVHFAQCTNHFQTLTINYDARKSVKLNMRTAPNVPVIFAFMAEKIAANFGNPAEITA
ncbi:MAG: hypothetical protein RLP44_14575 [Aggregatilineales bacterium]